MSESAKPSRHPFDEAIALEPTHTPSAEAPALQAKGHTHPAYANMVGPFGGLTAAQALNAVLQHPSLLGEPVALTVNFAAALTDGPFRAEAQPVRTNRSTQHWTFSFFQADAAGVEQVVLTGTAVTAKRRTTWRAADITAPSAPNPSSVARVPATKPTWISRYELRIFTGALALDALGQEADSLSQLWVRDDPPRPLDFCSLAALADVFFPRVYLRRGRPVPAGTVSLTTYFHAGAAELAAIGGGYVLGQAKAQRYFDGFFDQTVQLWSEAGELLVTSQQVVYFKE